VLVLALPDARRALLQSAGRALVAQDPAEPVDIIVVSVDAKSAGALEAADLVHSGLADRVAVFSQPPDRIAQEFLRRGLPYQDPAARVIQQLKALGVTAVERMPTTVAGTEDEGAFLPGWCDQNGFRTVIFISTPDHSRRTQRVLRRSMLGHRSRVLLRYSKYTEFDPDNWWSAREGVRTEIVEFEKLLLDVLSHPLS